MAKTFFEVFPSLQTDNELKGLLDLAEVTFINLTRDKSFLHVYLQFPRLVMKEYIYRIEDEIKRQLFGRASLRVKIFESFQLSGQYTLENLWDSYQKSLMLEMKQRSPLDYNLMRNAKWSCDDSAITICLEDTMLAHSRSKEIFQWLEKVLLERCGMQVSFSAAFEKKMKSRLQLEKEEAERQEIEAIKSRMSQKSEGQKQEAAKVTAAEEMPWEDSPKPKLVQERKPAEKKQSGDPRNAERPAAWKERRANNGKFPKGKGTDRPQSNQYIRSDDPSVIFGRFCNDDTVLISEIQGEVGEIAIRGQLMSVEIREISKLEKALIIFAVTDFTDTIMAKLFISMEFLEKVKKDFSVGSFVHIKGVAQMDKFDKELTIGSIVGVRKIADFRVMREDHAPVKRVELHCHTKSSEMDAVSETKDLIKLAKYWGHQALAITDHGCVYGFTDAFHALDKKDPFKVIYGCEGYLVDDLKEIVIKSNGQSLDSSYVVFDIETTGFSATQDKIIEIGAVRIENGVIVDRFSTFVNPKVPIPYRIEQLTSINDAMVMDAPEIDVILPLFIEFCRDAVLVAHNAEFDMSFILFQSAVQHLDFNPTYMDTVGLSRVLLPHLSRYKLDNVAKELNVPLDTHHRAVDDAECTAGIYLRLLAMLKERGMKTVDDVKEQAVMDVDAIKKLPTYHIIVLAKNEVGRINLYRLISDAHIKYFARRPRFPRSEIIKHREGLIIGSACESGELFQAIVRGESEADIAQIVNFYDYLEIQPIGNNAFMLRDEDSPAKTEEDLKNYNQMICDLGEKFHKPVCATCDVHFTNPEDEIFRRIIMAGKGFDDADFQPPLFYRTTEEMLKEFEFLGSDKAYEVVVTNTNLIADMVERIEPVRPDKCPPFIPNADVDLRDMCYKRARDWYGDNLPKIVVDRLERELNSIISNGFAVMYIIAQKLVWKSNADGYVVGSRGSVGSSFVATMSGITEVNPLSPHYRCLKCHYSDFDSDEVKAFAGGAGCDMPDKICPVCGEKLYKDGFDIPFETFLGFKGNKEPDIDLNFSGEYQSKAHAYTEVIFGAGQTFRAGTIGTLAEKTAFGYVYKYFEEKGIHKSRAEMTRIAAGCTGVKRTSGQHPGGIIVLPHGEEIHSFTPVQHPANDMSTPIITTHFDYHSIDHNLLKLDILGHDDPTMIRMLQDLTEMDMTKIPLDSPEVMSLFQNTSALGVTPADLDGCKLGALGIPEFGTDFAMQMLIDTKPQHFSDLVRIAGLSHGTDVWLGNAQTLLQEGKATISTCICTRDDIMIYLIQMGIESELSFTIMESVRKGKGLKPEWEKTMKEHNVPDWYIWSCKKIKYMFPKAHAAAYVMMAWRIAYCKVFYPLEYYAAFFSIRATGFSYELMCLGRQKLEKHLADYRRRSNELSNKEEDTLRDMRIVQEMYARGYEFMPLDIYRAKATRFQVIDGKLMASLNSIDGLGDKAAEGIEEAAKKGKFSSRDDFRMRSGVSQTVVDKMYELKLLEGMPESDQISFFDFEGFE
ncbi:MAG: PolC-type DNA polymerase III [Lachnospiraceae bacterium]